jgi:glycosyltransferase involved in cell wall biosynthesis
MDVYFTKKSKLIFKKLNKYIDYFAIFTPYDKKKLDSIFPNLITNLKNKIKFIPRACTIEPKKEPHEYGKNLIFIGRIMEGQKNFTGLIEIMALLPKDFKLNIYGNGPKGEIDSLTEKLKDHENITFCGPTTSVKEKLENNNIFLMTSFYEGFANTLVEARSQGLPIVAYDTFESLRWIIKDGESGYAIPLGESQKFADKILDIVSSKERYNDMSKSAIKMSESTEYNKIMGKWMDILKSS